ncbi:hypothetical protein BaRGS_00012755 [Batillaria attramentaria]|uniref:SURP and G-patch domain-containing protein 1 n=1 Tax=Batillaria attramentaria TaxID=370345 RepID=A0ABD0L9I0_9CAEN
MASFSKGDNKTNHEQFIEERKRKIQEKLAAAQQKLGLGANTDRALQTSSLIGKRPGSGVITNTPATKVIKTEPNRTGVNVNNSNTSNSLPNSALFSNDGNFLERFRKMQEMQSASVKVKTEPQSPGSSSSGLGHSTPARSTGDEYDPEVPTDDSPKEKEKAENWRQAPGIGKAGISFALAQGAKPKASPAQPIKTVASVFGGEDHDAPEDEDTLSAIEALARDVVRNGPSAEQMALEQNRSNPVYWFLKDAQSDTYKYYQWRVQKLTERRQEEGNDADTEGDDRTNEDSKSKVRRKKKSRWGNEKVEIPPVGVVAMPTPSGIGVPAVPANIQLGGRATMKSIPAGGHYPTLQDFARRMVGSDTMTPEQLKQIREQKEKKAKEAALMTEIEGLKVKPKYEYDSDEDTEGGTWEHKKRKLEMQATKDYAEKLTESGRGKHFIGDFLPPEELERFMETFKALKEGREPDYSDYKNFKITCENIGYQMMLKLGWKEGEGLGPESQGITAPVNKGNVSHDGRGLGVERPAELAKEDDEYDAYRKRMMLAYRFRPNPLNNPRRPYY